MHAYAKEKLYLPERNSSFNEEGQIVEAVVPAIYAEKFTPYLKRKIPIEEILEELTRWKVWAFQRVSFYIFKEFACLYFGIFTVNS